MAKLQGFDFWRTTLKGARFVVAPMVDQSELAWRLLSRRHGAQLCYTPMFHAQVFVRDANYRRENLYSEVCEEDRPLITQFCANDPEVFVQAALLAQDYCDAVDLNLGCPQMIAKRGHYGVFLQDEWDLLERMIRLAHEKLSVPVTCKIRVFEDVERTVRYAQMLEKAGCQLLTVHGRTKDQKGPMTGVASWEHIKAVRLQIHQDLREELAKVKTLQALAEVSSQLRRRCQEERAKGKGAELSESTLPLPHWICQPYVRPEPKPPLTNGSSEGKTAACKKRTLEDLDGTGQTLSKNKQKKRSRNPKKNFSVDQKPKYLKCEQCGNPKGNKCVFNLCRGCCKKKAFKEVADCPSHGLRFKTKAEKRRAEESGRNDGEQTEKRSCSAPPDAEFSPTFQEQPERHLLLGSFDASPCHADLRLVDDGSEGHRCQTSLRTI
ncbi:tRNA-dihydrouridine(16/17) synthase [NAD(P)(+)]-like isoform X3 [Oryzias latipes]|uniref:tRNA-dihydrouridine(16/17) synthase [NAD(P)(+)]-like isoform X3 n=1 Tax=Oryzias latipes TaxID=8090 RepID=UPI000CE19AD3|nr:tRNA-dihydrouridine(16/17) synthase [NAD(P)(+)]-like isoform X3 [Oryzias latipes]